MSEFSIVQEESLDPNLQLIRIHDTLVEGESGIVKFMQMMSTVGEPGSAQEQLTNILNYTVPAGKVVHWYVHIHLKLSNPVVAPPPPDPGPLEENDPNVTP